MNYSTGHLLHLDIYNLCAGSNQGVSLEHQGISVRAQRGQCVGTIQLHWWCHNQCSI